MATPPPAISRAEDNSSSAKPKAKSGLAAYRLVLDWVGQLCSALDSEADVPGAEHEFFHRELVSEPGQILPRLDERITEHRSLHQPEAERQDEPAAETGRQLGIHDDEAAAGAELVPGFTQHRQVMRHGVVGKSEHDTIERDRCLIFRSVAFDQLDVAPAIAIAKLACLGEHARRDIDAVDTSPRPDRATQEGEVPAGAASDFEDMAARPEVESIDGFLAEARRLEKQPIEERDQAGQAVVALCDEPSVEVDPLMSSMASTQRKLPPRPRGGLNFRHARLLCPVMCKIC